MMEKMKRILMGMLSVMLLSSVSVFGQVKIQEARYDSAGSYSTWNDADNQGSGFTAWDLTDNNNDGSSIYTGYYIGNSPTQNGRDSIGSGNSKVFGIYANTGGATAAYANAKRNFADTDGNPRSLVPGETFTFEFAFSWSGGKRGFNLYSDDSWNNFLFNVEHSGSDALNSDAGTLLGNIYNKATTISFTWNGGVSDNLTISAHHSGATNTITTTISAAPKGFSLYTDREGSGDNGNYEPFFNNFRITPDYFELSVTGTEGWRMLSFPKTGGTVADIADNTAIQGVTGGANPGLNSTFQTYNSSGAFAAPIDNTTAIGDGYGFITYFYDNTNGGSTELPITLDASGAEPSAAVSVALNTTTKESGSYFTMVGNPFASNYDVSSISASGGAIQNSVQFWDNASGSYVTKNRTTSFIVSPWQGFWVESADKATQVTFPTSGKTTSATTATYFQKVSEKNGDINFELSSETTLDKAIRMSFRENANVGWDVDDASKFIPLLNSYATLGFVDEGGRVQSVLSLPYNLKGELEIGMQESMVGTSGEFTLSWKGIETLPEGMNLEFHDYTTGKTVNMMQASSYTFEASETAEANQSILAISDSPTVKAQKRKSLDGLRFSVTVSPKMGVSIEPSSIPERFALEQNYPNPFNPTTRIQYSVAESGPVLLTIYNVMGQQVATLIDGAKSAGTYRISWDAGQMASGIYYYRLQAGNQILTRQMTLIKQRWIFSSSQPPSCRTNVAERYFCGGSSFLVPANTFRDFQRAGNGTFLKGRTFPCLF